MLSIDTIIFDFDGVIIDTETPDFLTWQKVFQAFGVDLEMVLWLDHVGGRSSQFDVFEHLQDLTGLTLNESEIKQRRRQEYLDLVESYPLMPGVLDYLDICKVHALKVGLASSSPREWVEGHLSRMGILEYFDCIRSIDDVINAKPYPDLYISCMDGLTATPKSSIAIEDSLNGVTAAKKAQMWCVAIPNSITAHLSFEKADVVLESLDQVNLIDLIKELPPNRH